MEVTKSSAGPLGDEVQPPIGGCVSTILTGTCIIGAKEEKGVEEEEDSAAAPKLDLGEFFKVQIYF